MRTTCSALVAALDADDMISYGANFTDRFQRSADLVDKFCAEPKPADIPLIRRDNSGHSPPQVGAVCGEGAELLPVALLFRSGPRKNIRLGHV